MKSEFAHLSEQDLVLAANGELSAARKAEVAGHLETCWSCNERMLALQDTIANFVRARNQELQQQIPSAEGPRALLRASMTEVASAPLRPAFPGFLFPSPFVGRLVVAFGAVLLILLVVFQSTVSAEGPKPKFGLTPGETRPMTLDEVCLYPRAEVISRDIPEDMRRQVFVAYGIKSPQAGQFEVDYLITPDLGGTESVHNLWPQPYSARWNAHVKDQLEQKLHELVCDHRLSLATAQHDIAVDWIAAYKKYVGENKQR